MSGPFEIRKAGIDQIETIRSLSREIWMEVYPSIISVEQIEYMLDLIYSVDALKHQIQEQGHAFILLTENDTPIGYASYSKKEPITNGLFRLHKFYLQPAYHGKGLGKGMLNEIIKDVISQSGNSLELNVNKYNPTLGFYKKNGFSIISEEVIDIGNGYVMDDYIMELKPLKYPI
jgi:ribosomal protein S18 acetylase RimI-like enzyme